MDYDKIFERNIDADFFYTNYQGNKLMEGRISLENAIARLSKNEHYVLVTYTQGQELPKEYIPLPTLQSDDETLFATVNPDLRFWYICQNGGIQMISRLPNLPSGSPNYLLGPGNDKGDDTVSLEGLVMKQHDKYMQDKTQSTGRGR